MTIDEPQSDRKLSKRRKKRKTSSIKTGAVEHPNAFVCFRIKNRELVNALSVVQNEIREKHDELKNTFIEPSTFHVTLAVLRLTEEDEKTVVDLLEKTCREFTPFTLDFDGLSCFSDRVIYANVINNHVAKQLFGLQEHLISQLVASELTLFNQQEFTAHATVLKLSKDRKLRNTGYRSIPGDVYAEYVSRYFGQETVDELLLCKMLMADSEGDKFYQLIGKASLAIPDDQPKEIFPVSVDEEDVTVEQNGEAPLDGGKRPAVNGYCRTEVANGGNNSTHSVDECQQDEVQSTREPTSNEDSTPPVILCTEDGIENRLSGVNGHIIEGPPHPEVDGMVQTTVTSQPKVEISRNVSEAPAESFDGENNAADPNAGSDHLAMADDTPVANGGVPDSVQPEAQTVEDRAPSLVPSSDATADKPSPIAVCNHTQNDCPVDLPAKPERKKKKWTVRRLLSHLVACTKIQSRE